MPARHPPAGQAHPEPPRTLRQVAAERGDGAPQGPHGYRHLVPDVPGPAIRLLVEDFRRGLPHVRRQHLELAPLVVLVVQRVRQRLPQLRTPTIGVEYPLRKPARKAGARPRACPSKKQRTMIGQVPGGVSEGAYCGGHVKGHPDAAPDARVATVKSRMCPPGSPPVGHFRLEKLHPRLKVRLPRPHIFSSSLAAASGAQGVDAVRRLEDKVEVPDGQMMGIRGPPDRRTVLPRSRMSRLRPADEDTARAAQGPQGHLREVLEEAVTDEEPQASHRPVALRRLPDAAMRANDGALQLHV